MPEKKILRRLQRYTGRGRLASAWVKKILYPTYETSNFKSEVPVKVQLFKAQNKSGIRPTAGPLSRSLGCARDDCWGSWDDNTHIMQVLIFNGNAVPKPIEDTGNLRLNSVFLGINGLC